MRVPLTRPWASDVTSVGVIATHVVRSDGAEGWGFSWTPQIGAEAVLAHLNHDIAPFAVGRAADPEALWDDVWAHVHEAGGGGVTTIGIAGLDLALWDAAARAAGTSITDHLGRERDAVARLRQRRQPALLARRAARAGLAVDRRGVRRREDQGRQARPRRGRRARPRRPRAARTRPRAHDRRQPAVAPRAGRALDRGARAVRPRVDRRAPALRRPRGAHRARAPHRRADRGRREPAHGPPLPRLPRGGRRARSCSPTSSASAASRRSGASRRSPPSTACRCIRTCCPSSPDSSRSRSRRAGRRPAAGRGRRGCRLRRARRPRRCRARSRIADGRLTVVPHLGLGIRFR